MEHRHSGSVQAGVLADRCRFSGGDGRRLPVGRYLPIEQIGGLPIPGILPGAAAFMLLVGVLASLGPARRGLRIDLTESLRSD
jgi:hypothetical protein